MPPIPSVPRAADSRIVRVVACAVVALLVARPVVAQIVIETDIDLTQQGLVHHSQRDYRWADFYVGPNPQSVTMAQCGCLLAVYSALMDFDLKPLGLGTQPWYQMPLRALPGYQMDWTFSPVYIDQFVKVGITGSPLNNQYKPGAAGKCGTVWPGPALAHAGNAMRMSDGTYLFPQGAAYRGSVGLNTNVVNRNLLLGRPTIVLRKVRDFEGNGHASTHALLIVGWDNLRQMYLIFDPMRQPWNGNAVRPAAAADAAADNRGELTYDIWESLIVVTLDVQPVEDNVPWFVMADDPALIDILATSPDGRRTGVDGASALRFEEDPAVNYVELGGWADPLGLAIPELPSKFVTIKDPALGVYQFQVVAKQSGPVHLSFYTLDGATVTVLQTFDSNMVQGETRKFQFLRAGAGHDVVVEGNNLPPQAKAGADQTNVVTNAFAFSAAGSFDADGTIVSYHWDFGDGQTAEGSAVSHLYSATGSFAVTLTVTDNVGATGTALSQALVFPLQSVAGLTERVSVSTLGVATDGFTSQPAISADGRYVAFRSNGENLVLPDTNGNTADVYVRDRSTGITERVSVSTAGVQGTGEWPSLSADGRFVAFLSLASNLVPDDTNDKWDVFVRDRLLGTTRRVSVSSAGAQSIGGDSYTPIISANGRFVAFMSTATNLWPGDTNGSEDVFVHDLETGITEVISPGRATSSGHLAISGDGRFVAYNATLFPTGGASQVVVYDRTTGVEERVTVTTAGGTVYSDSINPGLSDDGRFVVFSSYAPDLVADDTNGAGDVFVRDRLLQTTERVSLSSIGGQSAGYCFLPSISANGRFVAFLSQAANLVVGDTNSLTDVFVRDRLLGLTERVSVSSTGAQSAGSSGGSGNDENQTPGLSADGGLVVFASMATNLVANDVNNLIDIFVRDRRTPTPVAIPSGPYVGWAAKSGSPAAIAFHARRSFDPGGAALSATWDFGDGSPATTAGSNAEVLHSYGAAGNYVATLVVSNGVTPSSPVGAAVEVLPALEQRSLALRPACSIPGGELSLSLTNNPLVSPASGWDLGEAPLPSVANVAIARQVTLTFAGPAGSDLSAQDVPVSGFSPSSTLGYTTTLRWQVRSGWNTGSYSIGSDGSSAVSFQTPCPRPANYVPAANAGGPYAGPVGAALHFDGSMSVDADGDPLTYSWDFGDGQSGSGVTPQHAYAAEGQYVATLVVNDGIQSSFDGVGTRSLARVTIITTPAISWTNPADITYGSALSGTQLNATANVAGALEYTPSAGTVLSAGTHTLSVTLTPTDTINYTPVTRTVSLVVLPALTVAVTPATLQFSGTNTNGTLSPITAPQTATVTFSSAAASAWSASADQPWVQITNGSGTGNGTFTVGIVNPGNLLGMATSASAVVTVTASGVSNSPQTMAVELSLPGGCIVADPPRASGVIFGDPQLAIRTMTNPYVGVDGQVPAGLATPAISQASPGQAPFGIFDTPADGATGLQGSFAVTGWALDDVGVDHVEIWRDLSVGEDPTHAYTTDPAHPGYGKVFIATPLFVTGARTDIEALYPGYPFANRAGWGYLLLSWGLPNQGNGPYTLYAFAFDTDGHNALLGTKAIAADNAHATKPFGALDTPTYGGTVSGGFWNYGWALTPNACQSCTVTGDNVLVGIDSAPPRPVSYGDRRTDIAAAFPGFSNENSAGGAYYIDTTTLSNGMHQIGWLVYDSCGRGDGIGSRFFAVANTSGDAGKPALSVVEGKTRPALRDGRAVGAGATGGGTPVSDTSREPVSVRQQGGDWQDVAPQSDGWRIVDVRQGGRIEVRLPPVAAREYGGYQDVAGQRRPLPLGSSIDARAGMFYWQPAPAFLGAFDLVFEAPGTGAVRLRVVVK